MAGCQNGSRRRKRCRFCKKLFRPDPRLGSRQVACSNSRCQKARKKANQADWVKRHPGYFKGRYANTKAWLEAHPGYLRGYRKRHPERVARDNKQRQIRRKTARETAADIQDSISLEPIVTKTLTPYLADSPNADIQDPIWAQIITTAIFSAHYIGRRYTRLDRQDPAISVPLGSPDGVAIPDDFVPT